MSKDKPEVIIYTDGSADPNPGVGGYGVVMLCGGHRKELAQGFRLTTNNRMELLAAIIGLEALNKPSKVTVYSDSKYVVESIEKGYIYRWQAKNWMRTKSEQAKNADLWQRFLKAKEPHMVTFKWVPSHKGIEENERCDQLASKAAQSPSEDDTGYQPTETGEVAISNKSSSTAKKHTTAGEACRECGSVLERREPKKSSHKARQAYYYAWYLRCTGCKRIYMVNSAKRLL